MKKITFILMVCLSLGIRAQTPTPSCREVYASAAEKEMKREAWILDKGALAYGLTLPAMFTGNIFIVSGFLLTGSVMVGYSKLYDAREIRVKDLQSEGSRRLKRFTKRMKKIISPAIKQEEIIEIINEGLETGLFCENAPKLASPGEIKNHVQNILEERY
jgi:hypothetical protein